jgi:phospholipid/cholesterol/gamma-HCH transport system substrate-binding protein
METKVNVTVLGVFVLVLGAALIAGVLWLSGGRPYRKAIDLYHTYMTESVSGLNLNAPVRYRGVEVGCVRGIALAPDGGETVQLTLAIERGTPIKNETVAVLRVQGLTGIAYVELAGGSRESPPLQAAPDQMPPVIRSGPSLMERLDTALTSLLTNLNRSSENLNALLDPDNRRVFGQLLGDLGTLSQTLARRSATIDASLASAGQTSERAARLTIELMQLGRRIEESANRFDRMSAEVAQTAADVSRTAAELTRAGRTAGATLEGVQTAVQQAGSEALTELNALLAELRETSGSLRRLSLQLEHNPSVLLYGNTRAKRGPGE